MATCVTVTSSRAPSAPMTAPPSSSDDRLMSTTSGRVNPSSLASPLKLAAEKKNADTARVRNNVANVPARATVVVGVNPWVRYRLTKAMADPAITATQTGSLPSSTDGATKPTSTSTVTTMAPSADTPRPRPRAMTTTANATVSQTRTLPLSRSA